jgi:hypothetical protein
MATLISQPGYAPFDPARGILEPDEPIRFIARWKNVGQKEATRPVGGGKIYLLDREAKRENRKGEASASIQYARVSFSAVFL